MDIKAYFDQQSWIFAKTYADKAPHEYMLRKTAVGTEQEFEGAVAYIREHGFTAKFWNSPHVYLYLDGKFYWTMGAPIDETIVLNRCNAEDYELNMKPRFKK